MSQTIPVTSIFEPAIHTNNKNVHKNEKSCPICSICNGKFQIENSKEDDEEKKIIHLFFNDNEYKELETPLQFCPSCSRLRKTVYNLRNELSTVIDEISSLLSNSRFIHSSHLISKSHLITRLFQEQRFESEAVEVLKIDSDGDDTTDDNTVDNISISGSSEPKALETLLTPSEPPETKGRKPLKNFSCPVCQKRFKSTRDQKNHTLSHTNEKPFICEICGIRYRQKRGLEAHISIHKGESPFECEHCGKGFTQKSGLQRHLPIHTGETLYQCDVCGKSFLYHSSFAVHKLVHTGERRFFCDLCPRGFYSKSHLDRHGKVHKGEKAFIDGPKVTKHSKKNPT